MEAKGLQSLSNPSMNSFSPSIPPPQLIMFSTIPILIQVFALTTVHFHHNVLLNPAGQIHIIIPTIFTGLHLAGPPFLLRQGKSIMY